MNDYYSEIVSLAVASPEQEICGFLLNNGEGGLNPYVTKNVTSEDKGTSFEISLQDQRLFYATGKVEAVFHSHVHDDESFSDADIHTSERAGIPFLVYSLKTKRFNLYVPKRAREIFYERPFVSGLRDCYQLVADYLKVKYGIDLPYFPRTSTQLSLGIPHWKEMANSVGLKEVTLSSGLLKGDILLMSIRNNEALNHLAVYVGDGFILHQLMASPSRTTALSDNWKRAIKHVFRV